MKNIILLICMIITTLNVSAQDRVPRDRNGILDFVKVGCLGSYDVIRTISKTCPNGDRVTSKVYCVGSKSGAWPHCHLVEECEEVSSEDCPEETKEPEDGDDNFGGRGVY